MAKLTGLKKIYSSEVERLKDEYDNQILEKKNSIQDVKNENDQLRD